MSATATQTPYVRDEAARKGPRMYRKQILPLGTIQHPKHGELTFGRDDLTQIRKNFDGGVKDQVPFLLALPDKEHHDDPERVRGEVKGLDLSDDGLYALIETSERGAQVLGDNPKLPVSVRLEAPDSGPNAGEYVLGHVLGTLNPVATGMKPWEAVEAASKDMAVIDLSDEGTFTSGVSTDAQTKGKDALTDEEKGTFARLATKLGFGKDDSTEDKSTDTTAEEKEASAAAEEILAEAASALEADKDKEPVAASLSEEDRKAVELATSRAEQAEKDSRNVLLKSGKAELARRFDSYIEAGVPPHLVNPAREKITADEDKVIEFANEKVTPELEALFTFLDAAKGTIDFSEKGSAAPVDEDDEKVKKARKDAEAAAEGWV